MKRSVLFPCPGTGRKTRRNWIGDIYSAILSDHPINEKYALPRCVEGRCTGSYRSLGAVTPSSSVPPPSVTDSTLVGTPVEGLGWSMRCFHRNQTHRPPPLPTVHSTEGCSLRFKTYRYFLGNSSHLLDNPLPFAISYNTENYFFKSESSVLTFSYFYRLFKLRIARHIMILRYGRLQLKH